MLSCWTTCVTENFSERLICGLQACKRLNRSEGASRSPSTRICQKVVLESVISDQPLHIFEGSVIEHMLEVLNLEVSPARDLNLSFF